MPSAGQASGSLRHRGRASVGELITLREVLEVIYRRLWLVGGVFAVTLGAVAVITFNQTPIYESRAKLLVRFGRELVYRPEVGDQTAIVSRDRESLLNADVQIFLSQNLGERVVKTVGVENLYPDLASAARGAPAPLPAALKRFQKNLHVQVLPETAVIRAAFRHPSPRLAVEALQRTIEVFKEEHLRAFADPTSARFLEDKVQSYREQLEKTEQDIRTFRVQNQRFVDGGETFVRERSELESSLRDAENQIAGLREKLSLLRQQAATTSAIAEMERDPVLTQLKEELLRHQLEEKRLLGSFREDSRAVASVREQIKLVQDRLKEREAALAEAGARAELRSEIRAAEAELGFQDARRASLKRQLQEMDDQLRLVPQLQQRLRDLERNRDAAEKNYQATLHRLEEARLSEEMNQEKIASISVIEEPVLPYEPVLPRKRVNLALGALLGIGLGLAVAFVADSLAPFSR